MHYISRKIWQHVLILTSLSSILGMTSSANAASFSIGPDITFEVIDGGLGPSPFDGEGDPEDIFPENFDTVVLGSLGETSQNAEFNINNFPILADKIIDEAIFQITVLPNQVFGLGAPNNRPSGLDVRGFIGNGQADASDFEAGTILDSVAISSDFADTAEQVVSFDVTTFLSDLVSDGNDFAGFSVRAADPGATLLSRASSINPGPQLLIRTQPAEPETVPEPTLSWVLLSSLLWWKAHLNRKAP